MRISLRLSDYTDYTDSTDYTLRVLMYCAAHRERRVAIGKLAEQHGAVEEPPDESRLDGATLADMTPGLPATSVKPGRSQARRPLPTVVAAPSPRRATRPGRIA